MYEDELDLVEDTNRVSVTPICDDGDYGLMRADGNAGALRAHIARNEAIAAALERANFRVDDVVGVRMTGQAAVIIYVHTFHYR